MADKDIFELTRDVVADGFLDDDEVEAILAAARERSKEQPLTTKERSQIMHIVRNSMKGIAFTKLPMPLRVLSVLLIITGILGIVAAIVALLPMINSGFLEEKLGSMTVTTAVVIILAAVCSFVSTVLSFLVGLRLIKGLRGAASSLINVNIAVTVVSLVCETCCFCSTSCR